MSESNEFNSSDSINSADEELRVSRPLCEKNCLWGLRPYWPQTSLCNLSDKLEA